MNQKTPHEVSDEQLLAKRDAPSAGQQEEVEALRQAHSRLTVALEASRTLFETCPSPMAITDDEGLIRDCNQSFSSQLGRTKEDLLLKPVYEVIPPRFHTETKYRLNHTADIGKSTTFKQELHRKDGTVFPVEITMWPIKIDTDGDRKYLGLLIKDITERQKQIGLLKESEKKYRVVADHTFDWEYWRNLDGEIQYMSPSCERITGYPVAVFTNDPQMIHTIVYPDDQAIWQAHIHRVAVDLHDMDVLDFRIVTRDGQVRWINHHCGAAYDGQNNYLGRRVSNRDITERKQVEEALKLNEERLDALLNLHISKRMGTPELQIFALEEAVRLTHSEVGYMHLYDAGEKTIALTSWSKETLKRCTAEKEPHYPLEKAGIWADCIRTGKPVIHNDFQTAPERKGLPDGHVPLSRHMSVPVFDSERIVAVIGVGNKAAPYDDADLRQLTLFAASVWDIFKQKQAAEQLRQIEQTLRQTQRMEAIGTLAGGIAHDFNNILFPMVGFAEMLIEDLDEESPLYDSASEILNAALRARELVQQILAFSRQAEKDIRPVEPHLIIKEVLKFIRSSLPATIDIDQSAVKPCDKVLIDPTHVHQIAMNLITNAYHAMEASGGTLSVGLRNMHLTEEAVRMSDAKPGRYVVLSVADTGIGMDGTVIDRIFNPYFTTKTQDKGTGLGLSVVHGIVKSYGGHIRVKSILGKGSLFEIHLPSLKAQGRSKAYEQEQTVLPTGSERILLVDDEAAIVRLEKQILERLGYQVTERTSSVEALEAFKSDPKGFDAVVTDLTMPNMTGDNLARALIDIRADIPVIICTGFSERLSQEKARRAGIKGYLMKPVAKSELANVLRNILDERHPSED